jgi:hypothetical protein
MSSNSLSPSSVLEQMNTVFQADPTSPMQDSHGAATCAVFTSAVQAVRRVAFLVWHWPGAIVRLHAGFI